jgi:DNA repair exonuclease SbcCD nuclease subunit
MNIIKVSMDIELLEYKASIEEINYNRIFLISDLHFGVRANSLEWLKNQLDFFYNLYIPYLKENKQPNDILFILGDWFDGRQLLDINVMNKSIDLVFDLSEIMPIYFITGNHDIYKKNDTDVNSLAAFRFIPNVTIYEQPALLTNGNTKILVLPWIGNSEKEEAIAKNNHSDYIFAHADITGFHYDNGRTIVKGAKLRGIKGVKRLFSGHIHKRQENKDAIYIGSPYSTKRSDIGNKKGFYVFDPQNNKADFISNKISPVFQRIIMEDLIEWSLEKTFKILENNYTDIIVPDKYIHLFNLTRFIELLEGCNYKKIETVGEKKRLEESFGELMNGEEIKDIISLLENSIDDMGHIMEMIVKLKLINREYYDKASKENEIMDLI